MQTLKYLVFVIDLKKSNLCHKRGNKNNKWDSFHCGVDVAKDSKELEKSYCQDRANTPHGMM